jgi:Uma2 family endonuclease
MDTNEVIRMIPTQTSIRPQQRQLSYVVAELFPTKGEWTETDYWPLAERNRILELSNGELIVPPMPTTIHQNIVGNIYVALRIYLKATRAGRVAIAPLPVRLWEGKIREPDVIVMLNDHGERIHNQYWDTPDLVVEVLSPGTKKADRHEKMNEYATAGIAEYWIVLPDTQHIEVYRLEQTSYTLDATYGNTEHVVSRVLHGFTMPIVEVFCES